MIKLPGLANTYVVSSLYAYKIIIYFPLTCTYFNGSLVSCFLSILFCQLLGITQKLHVLMNTRSMGARCIQSCVINNIDPLIWYYIQGILLVPASIRDPVQKQYYEPTTAIWLNCHCPNCWSALCNIKHNGWQLQSLPYRRYDDRCGRIILGLLVWLLVCEAACGHG